jgi:pyrroline-5-carboxylate reductase
MAEAIINALSKNDTQRMTDVTVYDVSENRVEYLQKEYGIKGCDNIEEGIADADVVFLSVKPQNVSAVAKSLATPPKGLLLSIVAGCTIDRLRTEFRTDRIVRSMPNTPAMVLEGMTVWTATKETPKDCVERARILLSSIGDQIEVKDETYIDMATAVSGSGPAVS